MPFFQVVEEVLILLPDFPGFVKVDVGLEPDVPVFVREALVGVELVEIGLEVHVGFDDPFAGVGVEGPQEVGGVVIDAEIIVGSADNPPEGQLLGFVQALQFFPTRAVYPVHSVVSSVCSA